MEHSDLGAGGLAVSRERALKPLLIKLHLCESRKLRLSRMSKVWNKSANNREFINNWNMRSLSLGESQIGSLVCGLCHRCG